MMRLWLLTFAFLSLTSFGMGLVGCSAQPSMTQEERQAQRERQSIERPARDIDEETTFTDRLGQAGVVILVIGIAIAGIALPLLLL